MVTESWGAHAWNESKLVPVSETPGRHVALLHSQNVLQHLGVLPVCWQIRYQVLDTTLCLVSHILVLKAQKSTTRLQLEIVDGSWDLLCWPHALFKACM